MHEIILDIIAPVVTCNWMLSRTKSFMILQVIEIELACIQLVQLCLESFMWISTIVVICQSDNIAPFIRASFNMKARTLVRNGANVLDLYKCITFCPADLGTSQRSKSTRTIGVAITRSGMERSRFITGKERRWLIGRKTEAKKELKMGADPKEPSD